MSSHKRKKCCVLDILFQSTNPEANWDVKRVCVCLDFRKKGGGYLYVLYAIVRYQSQGRMPPPTRVSRVKRDNKCTLVSKPKDRPVPPSNLGLGLKSISPVVITPHEVNQPNNSTLVIAPVILIMSLVKKRLHIIRNKGREVRFY